MRKKYLKNNIYRIFFENYGQTGGGAGPRLGPEWGGRERGDRQK